jgi:L-fucose isomerase-like protein
VQALRDNRIGIVGKPSDWLIASNQNPEVAYNTWGIQCVEIHFDALLAEIEAIRAHPRTYHESQEMRDHAEFFREASEADITKSMDILEALHRIAARDNLAALTLRCFDLVLDDKSTGCLALSVLADEGIDAGCEGDIPSIIALHWIRLLTGQVGWMSNPSRITVSPDKSRAEILLAHCTSPRSTLARYGLRSHFESGLGVAIAGTVPTGDVTLVRIGGKDLDHVWFSRAKVVASPREEELCRTQAVLEISPESAEELLSNPLGNHLVMVHGDWTSRISTFLTLNQKIAR